MCETVATQAEITSDYFRAHVGNASKQKIVLLLYKKGYLTNKTLDDIKVMAWQRPLDQLTLAGIIFKEKKPKRKKGRMVGGRGTCRYNEYFLTVPAREFIGNLLDGTNVGRTLGEVTPNNDNLGEIVEAFGELLTS